MGWNDHVEQVEMRCNKCGEVGTWWFWDDVGKARYVGAIGEMVGQDASKPPCCPYCGGKNGTVVPEDEWD